MRIGAYELELLGLKFILELIYLEFELDLDSTKHPFISKLFRFI